MSFASHEKCDSNRVAPLNGIAPLVRLRAQVKMFSVLRVSLSSLVERSESAVPVSASMLVALLVQVRPPFGFGTVTRDGAKTNLFQALSSYA